MPIFKAHGCYIHDHADVRCLHRIEASDASEYLAASPYAVKTPNVLAGDNQLLINKGYAVVSATDTELRLVYLCDDHWYLFSAPRTLLHRLRLE